MAMGYRGKVLAPVDTDLEVDGFVSVTISKGSRTLPQNNAMHKYFSMVSDDMNKAGVDMRAVIKPEVLIKWDKEGRNFKKKIWHPIMKALTGKDSTRDLDTAEVNEVYENISRHLSTEVNITTPFPTWRHDGE